jgi:murein DD-endopeptidase MepM/ murein hydrolase activator NlpD
MLLVFLTRAEAQTATAIVTSPDGVNLRAGPGTAYPVLAVLPFGTTVTVIGAPTADNWVPVVHQGMTGYILGDYLALQMTLGGTGGPGPAPTPRADVPTLAPTPPAPTQTAPTATPPPTAVPIPTPAGGDTQVATVVPPDGLNVRAGPGTSFPVLVTMPGGARVQVIGRPTADGWYPVRYADKVGWADGAYLAFGGATPTPAASSGASTGRFIWPVQGRRITTRFSAAHPGIDIDQYPEGGNPVVAAAAGTVTFAGGDPCCSYGLYVIVKHADGYSTLYGHLASIAVSVGQVVAQGAVLGRSGNTGFSTGAHLHFEIRKDDVPVDPLSLLPGPWEE